jgi:hypothetical protein
VVAAAVALLGSVPLAAAQTRPGFSGTWTFVPPSSAQAADQPFQRTWSGDPVTIDQDATTITIAYVSGSRAHMPVKTIFNLDGSERVNINRNTSQPAGQEQASRAAWQGTKLALTTMVPRVTNGTPDPVEITEVLSLDSPMSLSVHITRRSKALTDSATAIYRRVR